MALVQSSVEMSGWVGRKVVRDEMGRWSSRYMDVLFFFFSLVVQAVKELITPTLA